MSGQQLPQPRRAVVFGAGGVLGFAWMLGAMSAYEDVTGNHLHEFDIAVGTSAGSAAAAMLACGLPVSVVARHHQGMSDADDPVLDYDYTGTGAALPPRPGWRPGAPQLFWGAIRPPRSIHPIVALTGLLPAGRGSLEPVYRFVQAVAHDAGFDTVWPTHPRPWIVVTDYKTGRRVVFGRNIFPAGAVRPIRTARLADAVVASCSIPAWYPPMVIDGVPYIDGGTSSNASVDVLLDTPVEEVVVFAPMASVDADRGRGAIARGERILRRAITKGILADVTRLRLAGKRVQVITPGPADLEAMGVNLMDPSRRIDVFETARVTAAATVRRQLALRRPVEIPDEIASDETA